MTEDTSTAPYTVTLKSGPGHEAPWIVVRADTVPELDQRLQDLTRQGPAGYAINDLVIQVANGLLKSYQAERTGATGPVQRTEAAVSAAPTESNVAYGNFGQAPQAEPPAPSCQHGARVRRTGNSSKGPWGAWFCPTPKGTPDQCEPIWDKK